MKSRLDQLESKLQSLFEDKIMAILPGITIKDRVIQKLAAALKQLAEDSRQHSGNLEFDVWQQTDRPNHFTAVEAWGSRGALNVHVMQKETREFRIKLAPMSGALYDKRLYKVLR